MKELWEQVQSWITAVGPNPYLQAAVILLVAFVGGKILQWVIHRQAGRWASHTTTDVDDRFIDMIHRPVFLSAVLLGSLVALDRLDIAEDPAWVAEAVIQTLLTLVWFGFSLSFCRLFLSVISTHKDRFLIVQTHTLPLFENLSRLIFLGAAVYFVFLAWEVDVSAWLASAGIIGIAVSFAARDTLANLFAGVFILADAPYKIGDFVILDSGERGRVTQIGLRSTRLITRDDIEITIPNAVMGNSKIVNESGGPHEKERIRIKVSVAYGSDVDQVREILEGIARSHEEICNDPAPRVRLRVFGASGLEYELLCWISQPVLRGRLIDAMNTEVYKLFMEHGVEIPYAKQDIYVKELPARG